MILCDKVEWQRKRGKEGEGEGGMRREGSLDQIRIEKGLSDRWREREIR